jgi:uncharacterized membrane protein
MPNWLNRALIALAVVGLLVSIYMTIYKLTNNNAMCLGSGDCSTVNASRYAEVNGIPVAAIGIAGYGAILALLILESRGSGFLRENGPLLVFGLSLTGFLFTLWLIYVEVALIKALCPFCLTSQAAMTLIFILSTIRLVRQS